MTFQMKPAQNFSPTGHSVTGHGSRFKITNILEAILNLQTNNSSTQWAFYLKIVREQSYIHPMTQHPIPTSR